MSSKRLDFYGKAVLADFGHSRVKLMLPNTKMISLHYDTLSKDMWDNIPDLKDYLVVYTSVNEPGRKKFLKEVPVLDILMGIPLLKQLGIMDYSKVQGIGSDRIFGLAGAMAESRNNIITIDCGTAVTINVMKKNHEVLGGLIMPGITLQEEALKSGIYQFKYIKKQTPKDIIGKNTNEAIYSGIYYGIAGAIISIVSNIIHDTFRDEKADIFLTGGSSSLILDYIDSSFEVFHDELLVLKGLKFIYKQWLTEKKS